MAILLELILSIIACIQLHVTMLNVHGEYSKYEAIREYKALKAVIQSTDFFYKWHQCVRINYCNWILRSFGRSHITKQCACSTAGAIILPPFLRLRVDGRKRFEYATCGREFFRKKPPFSKISAYVWTGPETVVFIRKPIQDKTSIS